MLKNKKYMAVLCFVLLFSLISACSASDTGSISDYNNLALDDGQNINDELISIGESNFDSLIDNEVISDENELEIINNNYDYITDETSYNNAEIEFNSQNYNYEIEYDGEGYDENLDEGEYEDYEESENIDTTGIVMAPNNYSCGSASLATVLNDMGLNISLEEVSELSKTTTEGTSMQNLIEACEKLNLTAVGAEVSLNDLKNNNIVHLDLNETKHWTVFKGMNDSYVFLADSTLGNVNWTIEEFLSHYTGNAIIISNKTKDELEKYLESKNITKLDFEKTNQISGKGYVKKLVGYKYEKKLCIVMVYSMVLQPCVIGGHINFKTWKYVYAAHPVIKYKTVKTPIYRTYYVSNEKLTSTKYR